MPYAVENAVFQWEEGERRLAEAVPPEHAPLEHAAAAVLDELRRRLGGSFSLAELADFYAAGTDWATQLARQHGAGRDGSSVVDAAFARYARAAVDYAGGRRYEIG